jgi:hypothetical protein
MRGDESNVANTLQEAQRTERALSAKPSQLARPTPCRRNRSFLNPANAGRSGGVRNSLLLRYLRPHPPGTLARCAVGWRCANPLPLHDLRARRQAHRQIAATWRCANRLLHKNLRRSPPNRQTSCVSCAPAAVSQLTFFRCGSPAWTSHSSPSPREVCRAMFGAIYTTETTTARHYGFAP